MEKKDNQFLSINLKIINNVTYNQAAELIKELWEEVGVKTIIELVQPEEMKSQVIIPRNYEALFSSQIVGSDPDPYAFWHSSQTGEEGLNVADYVNKDIDQLLEDARVITDINQRQEKYFKFQEIISEDVPAIFLYSPYYIYPQIGKVNNFETKNIFLPKDRFSNIEEWYINTGKKLVW